VADRINQIANAVDQMAAMLNQTNGIFVPPAVPQLGK